MRACAVVVLFVCTHGSVVERLVRWHAVFVYVPSAPMVCHYTSDYWPGMLSTPFSVCVNTKYAKGRPFRFSRLPVQWRPKVRLLVSPELCQRCPCPPVSQGGPAVPRLQGQTQQLPSRRPAHQCGGHVDHLEELRR